MASLYDSPLQGGEIRLITILDDNDTDLVSCIFKDDSLSRQPSRPRRFVVLLGRSCTEAVDELVQFLRNEDTDTDNDTHGHRFMVLSFDLLVRPWWTRAWTFQEVLLARQPVFLVGHHRVEWDELASWMPWLHGSAIDPGTTRDFYIDGTWDITRDNAVRDDLQERERLERWLFGKTCFQQLLEDKTELATRGAIHLHTMLENTGARDASDARDKVYGLVGLIPKSERDKISIDYTVSNLQVYHCVICRLWTTWSRVYLLQAWYFCFAGLRDPNSPSWVLDFYSNWGEGSPMVPNVTTWLSEFPRLELRHDTSDRVLSMWATSLCDIQFEQKLPWATRGFDPEAFVVAGIWVQESSEPDPRRAALRDMLHRTAGSRHGVSFFTTRHGFMGVSLCDWLKTTTLSFHMAAPAS
ncbi:hypothetical protein N658DRAFT_555045 [Parathielavia hyrcaniae]|uniref:Heterokaryon incompatibility domain-containing protein n=1 Tax=Parathielavia hyrcaniae TaxID=113614 RepID=A0AAN6Q9D1_9PEZI|nr:hypothetical protein N658DRAFT_555045 [Parathielavia hyrcaniae]